MAPATGTRRLAGLASVLLGLACFTPLHASSLHTEELKVRQQRARHYESTGQWDKACDEYAAILRVDRSLTPIRESYHRCLRRYHLVFRHRDFSYRKEVLGLKYSEALALCEKVLEYLSRHAVDRPSVRPDRLLRFGIEELTFALAEIEFRQEYLLNAKGDQLEAFRTLLQKALQEAGKARSRQDVVDKVRHLALTGQRLIGLNAVISVMECACGACAAVDEYTLFLSPGQLHEWVDACKGNYVGVGLRLRRDDGKMIVSEVLPGSPAAEALAEMPGMPGMKTPAIQPGYQLVTVGKRGTGDLTADEAMALLDGEAGSFVEVIVSPPMGDPVSVLLRRRSLFVPSIPFARLEVKDGIGYLPITCFQETTPQELDNAIVELNKAGMRALVIDLRGNSGGVFDAAVEVAQRFLVSGPIVSKQYADRPPKTYHARNLDAWGMPLVVLVDGNTASAAEVLAGALKDNRRARVVGQTTFGKGSGQVPLRINTGPSGGLTGGVRLTVVKFFSPLGQPYAGRGILPHVFAGPAEDGDSMSRIDQPLEVARVEAHKLLAPPR